MEDIQNQNLGQNNFNQPMMPKQKRHIPTWLGFVIIIVFAIIAFGGVFACQYFLIRYQPVVQTIQPQTQAEKTASWKTYTNTQYGFEIKYQKDRKLDKASDDFTSFYPRSLGLFEFRLINDSDIASPTFFAMIGSPNDKVLNEEITGCTNQKYENEEIKLSNKKLSSEQNITWEVCENKQFAVNGVGAYGEELLFYTTKNNYTYAFACYKECMSDLSHYNSFSQMLSTFKFIKNPLVGIWQDSPAMAAGWSDRYNFFESGKYLYSTNEMDCENRLRGQAGFWEVKDNKLILTVRSQTIWIGGTLKKNESYGSCGSKNVLSAAQEKTEILTAPKVIQLSLSDNCPYNPGDPDRNKKCILIGGESLDYAFYKYGDDPSDYGEIFNEPVF